MDNLELNPEALVSIADIITHYCRTQKDTMSDYLHYVNSCSSEWSDDKTFGSLFDSITMMQRQIENILNEIETVYPAYFRKKADQINMRRSFDGVSRQVSGTNIPRDLGNSESSFGSGAAKKYSPRVSSYMPTGSASLGIVGAGSGAAVKGGRASAQNGANNATDFKTQCLNTLQNDFKKSGDDNLLDLINKHLKYVKIVSRKNGYYDPTGASLKNNYSPVIAINPEKDVTSQLIDLAAEHIFYTSPHREELMRTVRNEGYHDDNFDSEAIAFEDDKITSDPDYKNALSFFKKTFKDRKSNVHKSELYAFSSSYSVFDKIIKN